MKPKSYLSDSLQPSEQILFKGMPHAAALVAPTLWSILISCMIFKAVTYFQLATVSAWMWSLFLLPAVYFFQNLLFHFTCESAITTHRVLAKTGFIRRSISEISIMKVESSTVDQGVIGRIFGFGDLVIRGSGGHAATACNLRNVMAFRAAVQNITAR